MSAILSPNIKMNLSFEHSVQALAIEAGMMENVIGIIKKYLPGLSTGFNNIVQQFNSDANGNTVVLNKDQKKALQTLESVEYLTFEKIPVYVHEGYHGRLLEFVPVLHAIVDHMYFVQKLTDEYKGFLAAIITNKDSRISLQTHRALYKSSNDGIERIEKMITPFYKKGSNEVKLGFTQAFANKSEATKYLQEMAILSDKLKGLPIAIINSNSKQCAEYLNTFIERVGDGTFDDVSNEVIKDLGVGAQSIAQELEFVGINRYRLEAFINTGNELVNTLNKLNVG